MDPLRVQTPPILLVGQQPHIRRLLELLARGEGLTSRAEENVQSLLDEALAGRVLAVIAAESAACGAARDLAARFWSEPRLRPVPFLVVSSRPDTDRVPYTPNVRRILSTPFSPRAFVADLRMLAPTSVRLRAA